MEKKETKQYYLKNLQHLRNRMYDRFLNIQIEFLPLIWTPDSGAKISHNGTCVIFGNLDIWLLDVFTLVLRAI